jgi:hypothetical protein
MNRDAEDRMFRTAPEVEEAVTEEMPPKVVEPVPPIVSRSDGPR